MKQRIFPALALFFIFFFPVAESFAADKVEKVVKKVREKYEKLDDVDIEFVRTTIWSLADEKYKTDGKLYISKKNKYRVETTAQTIVTDGITLWTYSVENNQVIVNDLDKAEENVLPKEVLLKYTKDSKPELIGEKEIGGMPCIGIKFTPEDDDEYISSTIAWVNKKTHLALKIEQEDINENITIYELTYHNFNTPHPASLFEFSIPANVEVIDLR